MHNKQKQKQKYHKAIDLRIFEKKKKQVTQPYIDISNDIYNNNTHIHIHMHTSQQNKEKNNTKTKNKSKQTHTHTHTHSVHK